MVSGSDRRFNFYRVFGIFTIAIFVVGIYSPIPSVSVYAVDAPTLTSPGNYSSTDIINYPPLGIPTFVWSEVIEATEYRLQVDSEIGFNSPIALDVTTTNTQYTPVSMSSTLFADGEWYWRVRVEEPSPVSNWSDIWRFDKTWATDENAPILISPTGGASLAFYSDLNFSWDHVLGAARYRLQISLNDDFSTTVVDTYTLANRYQPTATRFANGLYFWRVIPYDKADHAGKASEVRSFTQAYGTAVFSLVPTQVTPADESFPVFTPTFQWTAIPGAQQYRLEYTSDENCNFSSGSTAVTTRQTTYTPTTTFPNDVRYCWRVRVEANNAIGDWSDTWHFQKRWYIQPHLLTPTNLYQSGIYPLYSWAPVPGAAYYKIDIDTDPSFSPIYETGNTTNPFYTPTDNKYLANPPSSKYYWRVTPIDGSGNNGRTSEVYEYTSNSDSTAPVLAYPLYYYPPNDPVYYGSAVLNPLEDRTVPYPTFIWHRVLNPPSAGGIFTNTYRIQVDTTPNFNSLVWEYDTENTIATPTTADPFTPQSGTDYFWHVCPWDLAGGQCASGSAWSQIWRARFDTSLSLTPTSGTSPQLLRPAHGQESVEATPLLEWYPLQNATQYHIQISRDASFGSEIVVDDYSDFPVYASPTSLAQRSLGKTDYGTFYWRVRGYVDTAWTDWSSSRRFQVASQSEWQYTRLINDLDNLLVVGDDPSGDAGAAYDLTNLYAAQSNTDWFFGFSASVSATDMTYGLYIDVDHVDGSGATAPPPERSTYAVSTTSAHQPEYAIFIDQIGGVVDAAHTWVFRWNGAYWEFGQQFNLIGGELSFNGGIIMIRVPNGAIGMNETTGSYAIMLFNMNTTAAASPYYVQDTVPSDPGVNTSGSTQLSRFTSVSDHMNLLAPPSTASGDPSTIPSVLPLFWDWPTGSGDSNPFVGSRLQIALDQLYTNLREDLVRRSCYDNSSCSDSTRVPHLGIPQLAFLDEIETTNNIYYWRVAPRYKITPSPYYATGAYASGWSFRRVGLVPQNMQISSTSITPSFSWDMVEGAETYDLQVSIDSNFGSSELNQSTTQTAYTPLTTLIQGRHYWRVRARRHGNTTGNWSAVQQFDLTLPANITGLTPDDPGQLNPESYAPTMCWDHFVYSEGESAFAAYRYVVQVSRNTAFTPVYDSIETGMNCWTPTKGYDDGPYYWRVAIKDGSGRQGPYSSAATFTKQYPITTLISPISGSIMTTPTFIWTPVNGAASYKLEVSLDPNFSPLYASVETVNTQYTPLTNYPSGRLYYWRVAIIDRDGRMGPFTGARIIIGNDLWLPVILR